MKIAGAKHELVELFQTAGIDSPEANAEWLLAALLNCSRSELSLRLDQALSSEQRKTLKALSLIHI